MTIQGVKKHLNQNKSNLDDPIFSSIRTKYFKNKLSNLKNIIQKVIMCNLGYFMKSKISTCSMNINKSNLFLYILIDIIN